MDTQEFSQDFLDVLAALNAEVAAVGEPVEGNYFYNHHEPDFPHIPIRPNMRKKRDNLVHAAQDKRWMLEIGLNAGHSALLVLFHCPQVSFHAVDVCMHRYTKVAAAFLERQFPGRFHFYPKGSVHALPYLAVEHPELRFDLIHIDGSHDIPFVETDFYNALRVAAEPGWILFDDTRNHFAYIQSCVRKFMEDGRVEEAASPWMDMHEAGNKLTRILSSTL